MSPKKLNIVISGATGGLGPHFVKAFLAEPTRQHIAKLTVLTRNPTSATAQELAKLGANVEAYQEPATKQFQGVDVYISTIGPGTNGDGHFAKQDLMEAAAAAGVKVYIPSEFGNDHRIRDFPHPEWDAKGAHQVSARKTNMKVIAVYVGLFLEESFGAWIGLDTKNHLWQVAGKATSKVTYTGKDDVAKVAVALSLLASENPHKVPDHLRIDGTTHSTVDNLHTMESISGEKIKLEELDLHAFKRDAIVTHKGNSYFLRFMMGEGNLDHSTDHQNDVVNPKECHWKWKTVLDFAKETGGKPE